jgi:RES domain-containing protein
MILYRFSRKEWGGDLSGRGAERFGGRWNSKGVPVIYCSESRALAMTEIIAYTPPGLIPEGYVLNILETPDDPRLLYTISPEGLPPDWNRYPHGPDTKAIGDGLLKSGEYLLIKAPSALVQDEHNFLINPLHEQFSTVKVLEVLPFNFNERLFK